MSTLLIGSKNYSSWSLRSWIFLRKAACAMTSVNKKAAKILIIVIPPSKFLRDPSRNLVFVHIRV